MKNSSNKYEKQLNALFYVIQQYPNIGRTKLMRFVFLTDFIWYNNYGETLLEDKYIRMPRGPVPEFAFNITNATNAYFKVVQYLLGPERIWYQFSPKCEPNLSVFNSEELELMTKVIEIVKNNDAESISEFTHKFRFWRLIENSKPIPKELFKLDDYEMAELESMMSLEYAFDISQDIEKEAAGYAVYNNDQISDGFVVMQKKTLNKNDDC